MTAPLVGDTAALEEAAMSSYRFYLLDATNHIAADHFGE
jgi:hypothetical protein